MKLATYRDGSRDGQLVVVSRDMAHAAYASHIVSRLQQVLDDWNYLSPQLQDLYDALNAGRVRNAFSFDAAQCMAPLPRAYQWVGAAAYLSHIELVDKARGAVAPLHSYTHPLVYQGASDDFQGARAPIVCASEEFGVDFEAGIAVITSDIPMGCAADRALDGIRLVMLVNAVGLHNLIPDRFVRGYGLVQSRPATAFSPVAITPDELGEAWRQGRVHLPLQCTWNGRKVGMCDAGEDMSFHFGQLIAHVSKSRNVRAGSVVGSGAVSNRGVEKNGRTDWPKGYGSIVEKRAMETIQDGLPTTRFMKYGDTIRMEMKGPDGQSLFGAIEQEMVPSPVHASRGITVATS